MKFKKKLNEKVKEKKLQLGIEKATASDRYCLTI